LPRSAASRCFGAVNWRITSFNNTSLIMKNNRTVRLSLRKLVLSALVVAPLATLPAPLWALPANQAALDAQIVSKTPGVTPTSVSATQVNIDTTATNSVVVWKNFGDATAGAPVMTIAAGQSIFFNVPASGAILNKVDNTAAGSNNVATTIDGTLSSSGKIFVMNKNGVILGATGVINASGVGLSTVDESEISFSSTGNLNYAGVAAATAGVTVTPGATITVGSSGNVVLAGATVDVAGTISAGTLTVQTTNGAVRLGQGGALTVGATGNPGYGNVVINTGTGTSGDVNVAAGSAVNIRGGNLTVTTNGGDITGTATLTLGDNNGVGILTATTGTGIIDIDDIAGLNNKDIRVAVTAAGTDIRSLTGTSKLQMNQSTVNGNLVLSSTGGEIASGGDVTVTGTGSTISLTTGANNKSITFKGPGDLVFSNLATNGSTGAGVTLTSTTGSVSLPAATLGGNLTVTAQTNIIQTAGALIVDGATRTATFDAITGSVTLTNATNDFLRVAIKNSPTGASIVDADGVALANATNATGAATFTATSIDFGAGASDNVRFGSDLTLNAAAITDTTNNAVVLGSLNLNVGAAGTVTLDGNNGLGIGLASQYGQVNVNNTTGNPVAGAVRVYESSTLNLGVINATTLRAYSSAGSIANTGRLNITGASEFGAGSGIAPGDISLNFTSTTAGAGNSLAGSIALLDDFAVLSNAAANGATVNNYLANNVTIVNEAPTTLAVINSTAGLGITGALSVQTVGGAAGVGNSVTFAGQTNAGVVTVNTTGALTAATTSSKINTANITAAGVVDFRSANNMTVNATLTQNAAGRTASFTSGNGITVGTFTSDYTGAVRFASGNNRAITDSVAGIRVFGPVEFIAAGGITVNRAGHSFGGVRLQTGDGQSATFVESGGLRLADVSISGGGSLTATSTTGSIITEVAGAGIRFANGAGSSTFNAPQGTVSLVDAADNNLQQRINVTASGDVTIAQDGGNISLGNITTGGKLSVTAAAGGNRNVTQASSARLNVFDTVSIVTGGTGNITLGNTGNRLGGVVLSTGSGNVTVSESTTLNLKSVATTGNFAATSEAGSIIDSSADVAVIGQPNSIIVGGTSTFSAPAGNITLGLAGSNYATVGFTTTGNVSVRDGVGATTLTTSTIGGTLSVFNGVGALNQSGAVDVAGNVTFQVPTSTITLNNIDNRFGSIGFSAGGNVAISEASTINLRGNSFTTGSVAFATLGGFVTSGTGATTVLGTMLVDAQGTIVFGAGSLFLTGQLTVISPTTKDLSLLSFAANLNSVPVQNLGTGTYIKPPDAP
jgi:hypothetical protein